MSTRTRRLLRSAVSTVLATGLGGGLLAVVPPAQSEPIGVPVPAFRGGTVMGWGADGGAETIPPASLSGKTVTAVAAGDGHSIALTDDGRVTVWGGGASAPPDFTGKTVTAIAAGRWHALALTSDGVVSGWGDDREGQATVPSTLNGRTVTAIAAGSSHSLALTSDGSVTGWGSDDSGESTPPTSLVGRTVTAIAAGSSHSLALTSDGRVTAWGRNSEGQATVPASLTGKIVTAIAAGHNHSLALTGDGKVTAWGENHEGQTDVPARLAGRNVVAIASAAGAEHSVALTDDGQVTVWGADYDGQLDVPPGLSDRVVTAVAAGGSHSLAIATDFAAERAPTLAGSPLVGGTLTVDAGRYTAKPDQLTYAWYADGAPVGTGSTFTPTTAHADKRITVQVTATLTGHAPVVTTSAATQPVIAPPTVELTTSKTTLRRGQAATLTWTSTFASTITASAGWTGARTPAGTLTIKPTRIGTTTYTLTATNPAGSATAQVQVRVTRPATRLRVKAAAKAIIDKLLKVTIRGLERGERYTIRIGKKVVAKGTAKTAKPVVRKVKLPKKPGRIALRVIGDQPDRTGTTRVRVRR